MMIDRINMRSHNNNNSDSSINSITLGPTTPTQVSFERIEHTISSTTTRTVLMHAGNDDHIFSHDDDDTNDNTQQSWYTDRELRQFQEDFVTDQKSYQRFVKHQRIKNRIEFLWRRCTTRTACNTAAAKKTTVSLE
mmetsp:Transcript_16329/g.18311  ORF Transcript_16329/g.18311 Transcript_16329/m.18311 type:complete len:136 (+) Transcript_16329:47-454(+)